MGKLVHDPALNNVDKLGGFYKYMHCRVLLLEL